MLFHNRVGQTPRKVFNQSHPERNMHGVLTLPVGITDGIEESGQELQQSSKHIKGKSFYSQSDLENFLIHLSLDIGTNNVVCDLVFDSTSEKITPCPKGTLTVPSLPHERIEWVEKRHGVDVSGDLKVIVDRKVTLWKISSILH